jgi:hypothetical protein
MATNTDAIRQAASILGKKGGSQTSPRKKISSAENGRLGGRASYHDLAQQRVNSVPELKAVEKVVMFEWVKTNEHWKWIIGAPVAEIVAWAETVELPETE